MKDELDDFVTEPTCEEYYNYVDWYDAEASVLEELRIEAEVYED